MLPAAEALSTALTDAVRDGEVTALGYDKANWPVSMIERWVASVWEVKNETAETEDSVVLYTNIEAAQNGLYSVLYAVLDPNDVDAAMAVPGFTWFSRPPVVESIAVVDGKNVINFNTTLGADDHELFSADRLPIGGEGEIYLDGDVGTPDNINVEFDGTFHRVAGTFTCTAGAAEECSATNNLKGELTTLTGTWTFTPEKDVMITGVLTDTDFLDFGFWVRTDNSGDSVVYKVDGFFGGKAPRLAAFGQINDTATYKGGAAGLYTKREFAVGNDGDVTAAGRFTATAEFTATFGTDDQVGTAFMDSIIGTISYFMDGDQMIDAAWVVELDRISTGGGEMFGPEFTGGTATGDGTWEGQFFGGDDDGGNDDVDIPTGVAGKFTAGFPNGDLVGAFGAEKRD